MSTIFCTELQRAFLAAEASERIQSFSFMNTRMNCLMFAMSWACIISGNYDKVPQGLQATDDMDNWFEQVLTLSPFQMPSNLHSMVATVSAAAANQNMLAITALPGVNYNAAEDTMTFEPEKFVDDSEVTYYTGHLA